MSSTRAMSQSAPVKQGAPSRDTTARSRGASRAVPELSSASAAHDFGHVRVHDPRTADASAWRQMWNGDALRSLMSAASPYESPAPIMVAHRDSEVEREARAVAAGSA